MNYTDMLNKIQDDTSRDLNEHIMLIDGMNTLIRSFSLIKSINPSGHHVGGLIGFLRSIGFLARTIDPTRIVVVWDGKGGSGNRKNIDPNYKAQRATSKITHWGLYESKQEESEALVEQLYRCQDYLECLPIQQIMLEKLEADDIIAFLAKNCSGTSVKRCTIVSSDKDFLQLVDDTVEIYSPIKKVIINQENILDTLKVHPENYNIVKALMGDNSDNLRGIKGVGIKTLVKELPELVTDPTINLDYIYEVCASRLESKKVYANIIHEWNLVQSNYDIMDLHKTILSETEQEEVAEILASGIPPLSSGAFQMLMHQDKIESITKNTDAWLENFSSLNTFRKQRQN